MALIVLLGEALAHVYHFSGDASRRGRGAKSAQVTRLVLKAGQDLLFGRDQPQLSALGRPEPGLLPGPPIALAVHRIAMDLDVGQSRRFCRLAHQVHRRRKARRGLDAVQLGQLAYGALGSQARELLGEQLGKAIQVLHDTLLSSVKWLFAAWPVVVWWTQPPSVSCAHWQDCTQKVVSMQAWNWIIRTRQPAFTGLVTVDR